jgi:hypothetical protein
LTQKPLPMKKTSTSRIAGLLYVMALSISALQAQDRPKPVAQKDGINLYIRFAEPLNRKNPVVVCELENTTDKPVPFQLQGAAEGCGLCLHLIGEDGTEIRKTDEWLRLYETGDSLHTRYGALRPGILYGPNEMKLQDAYGPKWASGVRLDIEWNSREPRKGPGPFGGQFGTGSGISGSLDLFPLTGKKLLPKPEPQEPNPAGKTAGDKSTSGDNSPPPPPTTNAAVQEKRPEQPPSAQVANGFVPGGISWAWIIGAMVFLLIGAFWLGMKSASRSD